MDIVTGAIVLAIAGYAMYRFVKFCGRLGTGISKLEPHLPKPVFNILVYGALFMTPIFVIVFFTSAVGLMFTILGIGLNGRWAYARTFQPNM